MAAGQPIPPPPVPPTTGTEGAPPAQQEGSLWGCLAILLVVGVLIGGGAYWIRSSNKDHIDNVSAGDCVRPVPDDDNSPYRIAPCGDAEATHKVLKLIPLGGKGGSCRDVAAASRSTTNDDATVCLGEKDADPAKAVNVAKEGDCIAEGGASGAQRVDCSAPEARYKVLKRRTDVLSIHARGACRNVPGTVSSYEWNWESQGKFRNLSRMQVDLILCLGKN